ncbi:hypothetical protein MMC30_006494 [Trapelia coarctata]|nr:hypothetical protein [Trapelia coarctata]
MPNSFSIRGLLGKNRDRPDDNSHESETVASAVDHEPKSGTQTPNVAPQKGPELDKYGLILLNKSTEPLARTYNVDVVAVHGLGGSAYETWTHHNGTLWLRDFLPGDLPGARVFTYGYNSTYVFSRETSILRDYARTLLEDLRSERTLPEEKVRPLIFALIIARNESGLYPEINALVSGILFLGTPHQGSPSATYATILSRIAKPLVSGSQMSRLTGSIRTELVQGLRANEKESLRIDQDFRVQTGTVRIASFIEQKCMSGLTERVVDDKSGFMGAPTERFVPMSDCDHSEICKHGDRKSNYKKLLGAIKDCIPPSQPSPPSLEATMDGKSTTQINKSSLTTGSDQCTAPIPLQINVPQERVFHYINRQALLADMKDRLLNYPSPRTVALHGMGGSGKTQLALEFCRQAEQSLGFMAVIWIDASSLVSVSQSYGIIARQLSGDQWESTDSAATISFVQNTLRNWGQRWLVVLDSYDNPKAFQNQNIRYYVPSGNNGHILFTSRHADSARLGYPIIVSELTEDESLNLLLQRLPSNDEECMRGREIAMTLGYLALALDQAGAYIRARNLQLGDFISHYQRRKEVILKEIPEEWEYRRVIKDMGMETALSIFTTWELSFEQISGNGEEKERKDHFLTLSSFLNNSMISGRCFQSHFQSEEPEWMGIFSTNCGWDGDKLGDVLAELQKLSLLQMPYRQTGELRFSLHPVVYDWLRLRKSNALQQQFAAESITVLTNYIDDVDYDDLSFERKKEITLHIDACVRNDGEVLKGLDTSLDYRPEPARYFARFYFHQGLYDEAQKLLERALARDEKVLGPEHPLTLVAVQNLAVVYSNKGWYNKAKILHERGLAWSEKEFGPVHRDTLVTVRDLAAVYKGLGQYDKAEELSKRALAGFEKNSRSAAPRHAKNGGGPGESLF